MGRSATSPRPHAVSRTATGTEPGGKRASNMAFASSVLTAYFSAQGAAAAPRRRTRSARAVRNDAC